MTDGEQISGSPGSRLAWRPLFLVFQDVSVSSVMTFLVGGCWWFQHVPTIPKTCLWWLKSTRHLKPKRVSSARLSEVLDLPLQGWTPQWLSNLVKIQHMDGWIHMDTWEFNNCIDAFKIEKHTQFHEHGGGDGVSANRWAAGKLSDRVCWVHFLGVVIAHRDTYPASSIYIYTIIL